MSANRIYLVCQHHPNPEDALLISERATNELPYEVAKLKNADNWFQSHETCGPGRDHYKLAYGRPQDWDAGTPVATAVNAAIAVNGAH